MKSVPILLSASLISLHSAEPCTAHDISSQRQTFEIAGKILGNDQKPMRGVTPVMFLHGTTSPFTAQASVDRSGSFKFKNLSPGMYLLVAAVPRSGEMRKTVDVGPGTSDKGGRIAVTLIWDRNASTRKYDTVSATQLSVPDSAQDEYDRALRCLERRDIDGAVSRLRRAVEIAPQYASAWNHLGTIAYQSRQYKDAENYFREALKQDPDAYSPLVNLGAVLFALGQVEQSLETNRRAVEARPNDPLAHSQLGSSCLYLDRLDEAEEHLREAKALDASHFSYPQITLAQVYERKQDYPGVVRELEEFLRFHPDSPMAPEIRKSLEKARSLIRIR